jgi:hypothetical protein
MELTRTKYEAKLFVTRFAFTRSRFRAFRSSACAAQVFATAAAPTTVYCPTLAPISMIVAPKPFQPRRYIGLRTFFRFTSGCKQSLRRNTSLYGTGTVMLSAAPRTFD